MEKPINIDDYISRFPADVQEILQILRHTIQESAPEATEKISYAIPTFYFNGNLVYFAAYKQHIGFYPSSTGIEAFKNELQEFKISKGTIQFPINKPLPISLIQRIVKFRVEANKLKNKK